MISPDLDGVIDHYPDALRAALVSLEGLESLDQLARAGTKVALIVDDPSRWTPVCAALPIVLERLHAAGVRRENVSISVGVGRHRAVDPTAMRAHLAAEIADRYPCHSPPLDDAAHYVHLGDTPQGVPVKVFRPVAAADLRILVGSVLPHLQAGFGGGYKLIFPGCSHRSTLVALHAQGLGGDAGRLLGGAIVTNPMRVAIRAAAALLPGPCLSVSHLLGDQGKVIRVVAGHPDRVQETLSDDARARFQAPISPPADIVVAGNSPWPGDPMMSFKVLLQHRAASKLGGVLAGLFWTDPDEIDRSLPIATVKAIAATGAIGGHVIHRGLKFADRIAAAVGSPASFMIRWAKELVVDRTVLVYSPPCASDSAPIWVPSVSSPIKDPSGARRPVQSVAIRTCPCGFASFLAAD